MTIYDLLRKLVHAAARQGGLTSTDAFEAIELIGKLEKLNALGTQAAIQKGQDPRE